jgi:hypothetical protein
MFSCTLSTSHLASELVRMLYIRTQKLPWKWKLRRNLQVLLRDIMACHAQQQVNRCACEICPPSVHVEILHEQREKRKLKIFVIHSLYL